MKARPIEGLDPSAPLMPNVGRIVSVRLDELRGLADEALAPDASKAQHDLRIAAKRLQSVLGDLHDCDLMLAKVEQIDSVVTVLSARRKRLFQDFVELWQAEASKGTWAALWVEGNVFHV